MKFISNLYTDVGLVKSINQDSLIMKHATYANGEILMAIVCDGMGGLKKGELASATVIRRFNKWFDKELQYELGNVDMNIIGAKWDSMLKDLNIKIIEYGNNNNITLGTTFSGIMFVGSKYVICHVGDSRIYHIGNDIVQLTEDHSYIAREIKQGGISKVQAKTHEARHLLLQCIGASQKIEPQIIIGNIEKGCYLLCSDGFIHEISNEEMLKSLKYEQLINKAKIGKNLEYLTNLVKSRNEKDNISSIIVKVS